LSPTVGVSVSPTSTTLSAAQTQQFTASITGSANTSVTWSISPAVGTIVNGLYTAPSTITTAQTVTVTATSAANSTKTASATVSLAPSVGVSLSPASVSLSAGQTADFSATVTGTTNTGTTWSLSPNMGSLVNGVYTAPTTISALQTILLTVTSVANATKSEQASITLTPPFVVSPSQISLAASQTVQFATTPSASTISWQISPQVGTINSSGLYTAPSSVAAAQAVTITATNSVSQTQATVNLTPPLPVTLPVEVMGPTGFTATVSFAIPAGSNLSGPLQLWMQIHGLRYSGAASVRLNGGPWTAITSSSVTLLGQANDFGGIGGGFSTLKMTLPISPSSVTSGTNSISFMFNGTDGVTSGFRVLAFNVLNSSGSNLVPASAFVQDDPTTWQPPSTLAADIAAGQALWTSGSLTVPTPNGAPVAILAHCGMCHTHDGRDLKYFNYSNNSIHARSVFHGLTDQQGYQIASYIRSLNMPNPGMPWNPPYQPGPGMDSLPVSQWAAGAGLNAVLDADVEMLPYVMPGGSTANWVSTGYLNAHEIPIDLQLPDWNRWLPTIHPVDAWGSTFTTDPLNTEYQNILASLVPNDPASYSTYAEDIWLWQLRDFTFSNNVILPQSNLAQASAQAAAYSTRQWDAVKLWEINQQFGLEGMASTVFGPAAPNSRAWYTPLIFDVSPQFVKLPSPAAGLDNGTVAVYNYTAFTWYQLQLILNDGNGKGSVGAPIDWAYALAYSENNLTWGPSGPLRGTGGMEALWLVKGQQNLAGMYSINPENMVMFPAQPSTWSGMSTPQKLQIMNGYLSAWFAQWGSYTAPKLTSSVVANTPLFDLTNTQDMGSNLFLALPQLLYQGVDPTLLNQIVAWASTVWPSYNWAGSLSAPCTVGSLNQVFCSVPSY
jgi:hypothetical protein